MTDWKRRPLGRDELCKAHFDARVLAPCADGNGSLVVCDTFEEFAPLLTAARDLRDACELVIGSMPRSDDPVVVEVFKRVEAAIAASK